MRKVADNLLQQSLPPPAGGSMIPLGPKPTTPPAPFSGGERHSWNSTPYTGTAPANPSAPAQPQSVAPIGTSAATAGAKAPVAGQTTQNSLLGYLGLPSSALPSINIPSKEQFSAAVDRLNANFAAPPLTRFTHHLGGLKGPADSVLKFIHGGLQDEKAPERFATFASLAGKPLMEPLMATPVGAPVLAGLYGMLRGGRSGMDAARFFSPILEKLGLGG